MGQEIHSERFTSQDFKRFERRVREETELLASWLQAGRFIDLKPSIGYELEAWLIGHHGEPLPINRSFIDSANDPLIVPELSRFNIELNSVPRHLSAGVFTAMESDMAARWQAGQQIATDMGARLIMIGTLPTVQQRQLCMQNMSELSRYHALNEQILKARHDRPLRLHIDGREQLDTVHYDVMLEAAATSFQLHLRVQPSKAAAYFNAAIMLSAISVAVGSNSPFAFGHDLWAETRIPIFEQAVASPASHFCQSLDGRVSFGSGYADGDLLGCFRENLDCFEPLLPIEADKYPAALAHLRLHNGTIWRWNRPLIGFEDDGTPHFRLEHRVISAGPTVLDSIANAALFFALLVELGERLGNSPQQAQAWLAFGSAKANFYRAARHGLFAEIDWLDGARHRIADLLRADLLPRAHESLAQLGIPESESRRYLDVIGGRLETGQTGCAWQRAQRDAGHSDQDIVERYLALQEQGDPVHAWPV